MPTLRMFFRQPESPAVAGLFSTPVENGEGQGNVHRGTEFSGYNANAGAGFTGPGSERTSEPVRVKTRYTTLTALLVCPKGHPNRFGKYLWLFWCGSFPLRGLPFFSVVNLIGKLVKRSGAVISMKIRLRRCGELLDGDK